MRGVGNLLERESGETGRSDREMTVVMLAEQARQRRTELETLRESTQLASRRAVLEALGRADDDPVVLEGAAARAARAVATAPGRAVRDEVTRAAAVTNRTAAGREETLISSANRYLVEIHKKYSIAFACIVFVLIGAPLAVRFPRGGVGMVIVASVAIFAVYWVGLIGGEKLADRGLVDPFWAMWTPNFLFLALGLLMTRRMGRVVATSRGGGWDDLTWTLKKGARRLFNTGRRPAAAGAGGGD